MRIPIILLLLSMFFITSCEYSETLELERLERQAIDTKLKNLTEDQKKLFQCWYYGESIPERAEILYMDKNNFIYFRLNKKVFAIKRFTHNTLVYRLN